MSTSEQILATWTIFQSPLDHPGRVVLRRFDIVPGSLEPVPHPEGLVFDTLNAARFWLETWHPGLYCLARQAEDHVSVVETWL